MYSSIIKLINIPIWKLELITFISNLGGEKSLGQRMTELLGFGFKAHVR